MSVSFLQAFLAFAELGRVALRKSAYPFYIFSLIVVTSFDARATIPVCSSELFDRLRHLQDRSRGPQQLLQQQLTGIGADIAGGPTWIEKNFKPEMLEVLEQRQGLVDLLHGKGLRTGESVVWLQQAELKELNEKLWHIGGTERFLSIMDEELSILLKNEGHSLGRRVHTNYKDRVFITQLAKDELEEKIRTPLFDRVAKRLSEEYSGNASLSRTEWRMWLVANTKMGRGTTLVEAHLEKFGIRSEAEYQAAIMAAKQSRRMVERWMHSAPRLTIEEIFLKLKETSGNKEAMQAWLVQRGVERVSAGRLLQQIITYRSQLAVADFLPLPATSKEMGREIKSALSIAENASSLEGFNKNPFLARMTRDSWRAEQAAFLYNTRNAGVIVAADMKGVGIKGLLARDRWLAAGADKDKIVEIYSETTAMLDRKVTELVEGIQAIYGTDRAIHVYRSGDDMLFALPRVSSKGEVGTITAKQFEEVKKFIDRVDDIYSKIEPIKTPGDVASISESIARARESIFDEKHVLK